MKEGIIIDSREDKKIQREIMSFLSKYDIKSKVKRLKVGDYLICGVLPIERKTMGDYTSSLYSGRLHKQYYELSKNYPISMVAIIGNHITQIQVEHGLPLNTFISSLVGTSLKRAKKGKKGVIVPIQLYTEYEFMLTLRFLYEKVRGGDYQRVPKVEKYKVSGFDRKLGLIASIEGVGNSIAKRVFKKYKSIYELSRTSVEDLTHIKGVGDKTAKKIWDTLH